MVDQSQPAGAAADTASIYKNGVYLEKHETWHVEDSPWKASEIDKILGRNNIEPRTVCEVGCGAGEILRQLSLKRPDATFTGYEISPQAFALSQSRAGARLEYRLKNIVDESATYDCLLCIDVFEHVDDYMGFLRSLKPKADYKIFHIPIDIFLLSLLRNSMMRAREEYGHIHYFAPETALATLRDCGYEIVDFAFTPMFDGIPGKSLKARLARLPRRILYALSPGLSVRILGGCSMMVLTR
ncbi:AdoMet_MTases domain containing protein [Caulobacteraceae bacterium]